MSTTDATEKNGNGKAKSRRYLIIKIFIALVMVNTVYVMLGIPLIDGMGEFIAYFLSVNTILVGAIGAWIGIRTARKKQEDV